ncbi:MAG: HTTM domain-containing protein [Owenweeksia sp.]|nr:HTTM domain-containing protein [Owenweeksia sp.]MBG00244.1 HTTM domain-containing protein [Owenweeksia sp.]HBF19672.1 HTTM domain-containing protein [Cryomorphaceae bacterium]
MGTRATGKSFTPFASTASLAPLAVFRIIFGVLMLFSTLRFWVYGWIDDLYIKPSFHFKYYGFEWVQALSAEGMYGLFTLMAVASLLIALGLAYRVAAVLFFLAFTYVELIDVTTYLNHYYFVSLVAFLLIWLPANRLYSLDVRFGWKQPALRGSPWFVNIIRLQLAIVYFYAGVAKLNPEWMLEALPLKIWLPAKADMPLIGPLLDYEWVAYAFSWFGAFYDLTIPFFLWNRKTRPFAYITVIIFHILTWLLFPIGVFPWVMIFSTLIFFGDDFHQKVLSRLDGIFKLPASANFTQSRIHPALRIFFIIFLAWQVLWPWRFMAYPGKLFWTEQGYRLSWRVMLMEKAGYVTFHITDPRTGRSGEAHPSDYLTPNQEKQMSTQPDLILQFAHYLEKEYQAKGVEDPVITAEAYVTLNGQGSRLFIDPEADLTEKDDSFAPKEWILDYED